MDLYEQIQNYIKEKLIIAKEKGYTYANKYISKKNLLKNIKIKASIKSIHLLQLTKKVLEN